MIKALDKIGFKRVVKKHKTVKHEKGFDTWSHLVSKLLVNL